MLSKINLFLLLFLFLFMGTSYSEELLQRGEAYILTESSWHEVKAQEKKAYKESKKQTRELKKLTKKKLISAEKKPIRFVRSDGRIFINKLYRINVTNEFKGDILVSIDNSPFQKLEGEMLILREGNHVINYKFLDEQGNVRSEKEEKAFLDLTYPEVNVQLEGVYFEKNSYYYYKPGVKLFIQAKDNESGLDDIFINVNSKGYLPMNKLDKPMDSPGIKEIKILATDNVTNLSQEVYLRYTIDSEPPVVDVELDSIPELHTKIGKICDRDISIRLNAFDMGSGVSRIEFRKKGKLDWRVYRDYPLVSRKKKKISLEYRAIDNLGNESEIKYFKCKVKNETESDTNS